MNIKLIRQVNSALFFKLGLSICGIPRWAPEIGGTTQIWGHAKKNFWRFAPEFVTSTSKPCRRLYVGKGLLFVCLLVNNSCHWPNRCATVSLNTLATEMLEHVFHYVYLCIALVFLLLIATK